MRKYEISEGEHVGRSKSVGVAADSHSLLPPCRMPTPSAIEAQGRPTSLEIPFLLLIKPWLSAQCPADNQVPRSRPRENARLLALAELFRPSQVKMMLLAFGRSRSYREKHYTCSITTETMRE